MDYKKKDPETYAIMDFDYMVALNEFIDPAFLNKTLMGLRGGNKDNQNQSIKTYRINNSNYLVNLYENKEKSGKSRFYIDSIFKLPDKFKLDETIEKIDQLSINEDNESVEENENVEENQGGAKTEKKTKPKSKTSKTATEGKSKTKKKVIKKKVMKETLNDSIQDHVIDKMIKRVSKKNSDNIKAENKPIYSIDYSDVDEYGGANKKNIKKNKTPKTKS